MYRFRTTAALVQRTLNRSFSTEAPLPPPTKPSTHTIPAAMKVFDRNVKVIQRNASALRSDSKTFDYLRDEVADRLVDRLLDIKRRFPKVLDVGSGAGHIIKYVDKDMMDHLVQLDSAEKMLYRDKNETYEVSTERIHADEEFLPFHEDTFDCVLSSMSMHWVNDLPGTLIQIRKCLKPDGAFLGAMVGGETLYELRTSLQLAQVEREGGVAPHVSPMADLRDLGSLLSRAGLTLTTLDTDEIVVRYPSMYELIQDLSAMGEGNAIFNRTGCLTRDTIDAAAEIYKSVYGNEDGSIPATFQILYMIGWKPDPSQPKPAKRGSGEVSLKTLESPSN
ncbi:S-adenosyl-L-methionine-dependent methyltransferase [Rhizoclosmatium globosum]|uniref:S-adenosyl-L-methionine-dependent methyltransferase n=1 Tax=Rhizoclosmatium globosum TaxID=329046 RepID=A0A1Y2CCI1_9FUNG|nr:S-adenosyl-L-methionine-dependent methyltransferase [Rhizoclosmatium globosum]|eukprot:ORY44750.1 S-adenosyl-L-methionine-dependent methyltransferase [Rhizoclosmatium globosum]